MTLAPEKAISRRTRSHRLLEALEPFESVLVTGHDNPDPDAIASGWAVVQLVTERLSKPARFVAGGEIIRAENREMVKLLKPPLELVAEVRPGPREAVVLVDCNMGSTHHLFGDDSPPALAVIDHHEANASRRVPTIFRDRRPRVAATATITACYLREQRVEPEPALATALLYAIQSETGGGATRLSTVDRRMLRWLSLRADHNLLTRIHYAPLSRDYFGDLILALQNTFLYDSAVLCFLPRASGPEIVGEVADLLVRCEAVDRVLCGAVVGDDVLVSVRTTREGGNATSLLAHTLGDLGRGGGHLHRAGGKLHRRSSGPQMAESLEEELRSRWLSACDVDRVRGARLVSRREIVANL